MTGILWSRFAMHQQSGIQDATSATASGPGAVVIPQKTLDEIKGLLREIRDLQKAHFEQYEEFTSRIMAAERVRQEGAYQRQVISWVVWGGIVVLIFGSMFLSQFLHFFF